MEIKPIQVSQTKIIHKYNLVPNFDLFAFDTKKKQYFDTLNIQKKNEMHRWTHNNDFDILQ